MRALNKWLAGHLWAQVLLSIGLATAVILVISPGRSPVEVLVRVAAASLGGLGVLLARRRKERRAARSSTGEWVSLDDRLRHGEVPESAHERESMRRLVRERLHASRHRWLALGFMVALFGSITVLVGVSSDVRTTVGFAVFALVFLVWLTWYGIRQRGVLRNMARELGDGSGPDPAHR